MVRLVIIILISFFLFSSSGNAQLIADFSANKNSNCNNISVQFSDLSTYNGSAVPYKSILNGDSYNSHTWIFENNSQSYLQNPGTSYSSTGSYDITLIVNNGSITDTIIKPDFIIVFEEPVANFTSDDSAGCVPHSVNFTDLSIEAEAGIASWSWNFGDGAFDTTQQNPSYIYQSVGSFTVVLQVTDSNGCQSFKNVASYIKTTAPPIANFTIIGQTIACDTPLTLTFNSTSSGSGTLSYLWNFGDAGTSTMQNPTHTFLDSGLFDVSLIITDQNGCTDSLIMQDTVRISDVVASFTISKDTVCPFEPVTFTSTSLNGITYYWNFGDNTGTSINSPANYAYSAAGDYEITLIATGPQGLCQDTIKDSINVELVIADFSADTVYGCEVPLVVQYTNNSVNAVSWQWGFGDGGTSSAENPSNTFNAEGSFTDTLIVTSLKQCKDTLIKQDYVRIFILKPDFSADTVTGCVSLPVDFTNITSPPDSILSSSWNFGDGGTSTLLNPSYTYNTAGEFTVTLTITDVSGCDHTITKTEYIIAGFKPVPDFSVDKITACAEDTFTFTDLSTDPALVDQWIWSIGGYDSLGNYDPDTPGTTFGSVQNPTYIPTDTGFMYIQLIAGYNGCYDTLLRDSFINILGPYINISNSFLCADPFTYNFFLTDSLGIQRWYWDFGDGSPVDSVNSYTSHTYTATGDYTITDTTYNDTTGCKMVKTTNIMVRDIQADFTMDDTLGCLPFSINFDGALSQDEVSYQWDFADSTGNFPGGPTFNHIFNIRGIFGVEMTVTDVNGCTDSIIKEINVYKPYAYFAADTLSNCVPFIVDFFDTSVSDTGVVAWYWTFGDGGSETVQNPSHTYTTPGKKNVRLIVTDSLGCKDTLTKSNYIVPLQPYPSFSIPDNTVCFGSEINFSNSSTYPNGIPANLSYEWIFSTQDTLSVKDPAITFNDTGYISVILIATDSVLGCDSILPVNNFIHIQPLPVAAFSSSTTFSPCYNPPDPPQIFFYDTSVTDYSAFIFWDFGDGSTSSLQTDTVGHAYTSPGTFDVQLIVNTTYGCSDTLVIPDYITVVGPMADIKVYPETVCVGDIVTYVMINANNVVEFSWDFGDGAGAPGTNDSITYAYNQVGTLFPKLIYSFSNGACEQIAGETVFIHQVLANFSSDSVICRDVPVYFSNSSLGANSFRWDFDDGSQPLTGVSSASHNYPNEGTYNVSLAIANNATGCKDTIIKDITVYFSCDSLECNLSPPLVTTIGDTAIFVGEEVTLTTSTQNSTTVSWLPPDSLSCDDCIEPQAQPFITTKYIVSVKDENNCFTGKDTVTITVINKNTVDVPKAFTPNSDGINDTVFVRGLGIKYLRNFQVFNRWGQVVYESADIKEGWDGTYKNEPQNAETYYYIVAVEYYDQSPGYRKGYITLIR